MVGATEKGGYGMSYETWYSPRLSFGGSGGFFVNFLHSEEG
jgi:hypothetical protein